MRIAITLIANMRAASEERRRQRVQAIILRDIEAAEADIVASWS